MNIEEAWNKALKNTEIIRARIQSLYTFQDTKVPYILLSESSINLGDTVVRQGDVLVEKPSLILPDNLPHFKGFDFDQKGPWSEDSIVNFLLIRGITLPSFRFNHLTNSLDVFEGRLDAAIKYFTGLLQAKENVHTGLLTGPEDCWQFSLLIFVCSQIQKNADYDIKKIIDQYRKRKEK